MKHPSEIAETNIPYLIEAGGGHVFGSREGLVGGTKFAYPQCFSPFQIHKEIFHDFKVYKEAYCMKFTNIYK